MSNASPVPHPGDRRPHASPMAPDPLERVPTPPPRRGAALAGGTREEPAAAAGPLHLLEHLLLRRTAPRVRRALADASRRSAAGQCRDRTRASGFDRPRAGGARAGARRAAGRVPVRADVRRHRPGTGAGRHRRRAHLSGADATDRGAAPSRLAGASARWPLLPVDPAPTSPAALRALWAARRWAARLRVAVAGGFDPPAMHAALGRLGALPTGTGPPGRGAAFRAGPLRAHARGSAGHLDVGSAMPGLRHG